MKGERRGKGGRREKGGREEGKEGGREEGKERGLQQRDRVMIIIGIFWLCENKRSKSSYL